MTNTDKFSFSADRPILTINEDLLGRAKFSENLAEAISNWNGRDSLVVALHGDWGAGKSSVKNMAMSYLNDKELKPTIIEFNPWEWAAQEKITKAFFEEISKSIDKESSSDTYKKLSGSFKKYGNYLAASEVILNSTSFSLPIIISVIAGIGFFSAFSEDTRIVTLITTGIILVSPILKWVVENLKKLAGYYDEKSKDSEKNLTEIRNELKENLKRLEVPILIVMDDLDRLSTPELRMIFQLIKANTEFPNVTFLLLFQRNIVEGKLTDSTQSGKDYLEKIIQVPFNLPNVEQSKVYNVLFSRLNKILETDESYKKQFDNKRWTNIYHSGLKFLFSDLRSVYRYTSTLEFYFALLKGKNIFEGDPVDLMTIECIRVFEPDVYSALAKNKEAFTIGLNSSCDNEEKEKIINKINLVINKANENNKEIITNILKELFPAIESIIDNIYWQDNYYSEWFTQSRICHESNFDQYFQFSLENIEIKKSDLIDFLELTSDYNGLKNRILELNQAGTLKEFLSQFESYTNKIPIDSAKPYISALLDVGDYVDTESSGFFDIFSAQTYIFRLLIWFLKRIENKKFRGELILEQFKLSNGLIIISDILIAEEEDREKQKSTLLNDSEYHLIKAEFVNKIKNSSNLNSNFLLDKKSFLALLYRWDSWGNPQDVKNWLKNQISNINDLILILSKMIRKSKSQLYNDYEIHENSYLKIETLEYFLDIEMIKNMIEESDLSQLSQDEVSVLDLFHEALQNLQV